MRVRRRFWQRLLYTEVYRCVQCSQSRGRRNPSFVFSRKSLCPRCGTRNLRVRRRLDPIDTLSRSFLSTIQRVFGAELHHCEACRLQFYDFRKVAEPPQTKNPHESSA